MPTARSNGNNNLGDIEVNNANKAIVIENGTVGGIITTKITRFPDSLLPTIAPRTGAAMLDGGGRFDEVSS